jgi:hypothetical protein
MKHILYAVEALVSFNPVKYELLRREDENGPGSVMTWAEREDAEARADGIRQASGDPDMEIEVVILTGTTESENEPEGGFPVPVLSRGSDDCANC